MFKNYLLVAIVLLITGTTHSQNIFSISGNQTMLNGETFQVIGLRCANALLSDSTVNELIAHLDEYKSYGINTVSVYLMGSRYSNIHGFNLDGSLNDIYRKRLERIIEICDEKDMVVLVGILYWGAQVDANTNAYYKSWTQEDAENAILNSMRWLTTKKYRNIFVEPDNEGMAERGAKFNIDKILCAAKEVNPSIVLAYNGKSFAPPCADMGVHFCYKSIKQPYIESEGTPSEYWGFYSKENGLDEYINVGVYTETKKAEQKERTRDLLNEGSGYMFASTWLQNVPPNYHLGGDGSPCNPGIRWWLEFIKSYLEEEKKHEN